MWRWTGCPLGSSVRPLYHWCHQYISSVQLGEETRHARLFYTLLSLSPYLHSTTTKAWKLYEEWLFLCKHEWEWRGRGIYSLRGRVEATPCAMSSILVTSIINPWIKQPYNQGWRFTRSCISLHGSMHKIGGSKGVVGWPPMTCGASPLDHVWVWSGGTMCVDVGLVTCGPSNPCAFILSHLRNTLVIQGLIVLVEVLGRIMEACEGLRTHRGGRLTPLCGPIAYNSLHSCTYIQIRTCTCGTKLFV
jgi:hypothetical protein